MTETGVFGLVLSAGGVFFLRQESWEGGRDETRRTRGRGAAVLLSGTKGSFRRPSRRE